MWLFTKFGFFSAVCARQGDGSRLNPPDPHRMMIRARDRDHLERLVERFPSLKQFEIIESTHNDYRFRIIIPKWRWRRVMDGLVKEQDYDNFKSEVDKVFGTETAEQRRYHDDLLMRVWSIAYGFQTRKYGPGIYAKPKKKGKAKRNTYAPVEQQTTLGGTFVETMPGRIEDASATFRNAEPGKEEPVLMVLDQDTGEEIVCIWCPHYWDTDAEAYADAVTKGNVKIVAHPEYQKMSWRDAKLGNPTVHDPFASGVKA